MTLLLVAGGSAACADEAPRVAFDVGAATDYVAKGITFSAGQAAASLAARVTDGPIYASASAYTAKLPTGADYDVIVAVGVKSHVAGFDYDVAVWERTRPGTRAGYDNHYEEYQADVSRSFGRLNLRLRTNYSPDGYGPCREAWWTEGQAGWALSDGDKVSAGFGVRKAKNGVDYDAWNLGVKHKLTQKFVADLRWYDTDNHAAGKSYDSRLVVALTYSL